MATSQQVGPPQVSLSPANRPSRPARALVAGLVMATSILIALTGGLWSLRIALSPAKTTAIAGSLEGAARADVTIRAGAAALRIEGSEEAGQLIAGSVQRARGERLEQAIRRDGAIVRYALRSERERTFPPLPWQDGAGRVWDLRLADEIPLNLTVETGVGEARLDLARLQLSGLTVRGGVGQLFVTLPDQGGFSATIEGGISETVVRVPAGLGVRVRVSTGAGSFQLPPGYERQGDIYTSPGYDAAAEKIELVMQAGVGRIIVEDVAAP
jgi:hypothetical protein